MAGIGKPDALHGVMKLVVVGDAGEQRSKLKAVLGTIVDPQLEVTESEAAGAEQLIRSNTPPDAVMVLVNGTEESSLKFLQTQAGNTPRPVLLAALSAHSAGVMKRALRSGADEILLLPLDPGEATRALLKITEARWRKERRDGGVICCSLVSLVGGVGVTSLAANLALALQGMHQRAVLVDLDLQSGGLAVFMNLDPELTIMPLARLDRKVDSIQLESALTKHPSGCYLLAAPKRIEEGELVSDITVATVLDLMRELFDYVIVDCGDHVDENAVAAWERSDHLFYVLNQSIASTRCAWRFVDLFERLRLTSLEPRFVMNRYLAAHPLGEKEIEATLAKPIFAKIPADDATFEKIEMSAHDLFTVAPHSAVAKAVMALATQMMPRTEIVEAAAPGLVSRLLSVFTPLVAR